FRSPTAQRSRFPKSNSSDAASATRSSSRESRRTSTAITSNSSGTPLVTDIAPPSEPPPDTPSRSSSSDTASLRKIPLTAEHYELIASVLLDGLSTGDIQNRMLAARLGVQAHESNIRLEEFLDRQRRLDAGTPTEIVDDKRTIEVRADGLLSEVRAILGQEPRRRHVEAAVRPPEEDRADARRLPDRAGDRAGDAEAGGGAGGAGVA